MIRPYKKRSLDKPRDILVQGKAVEIEHKFKYLGVWVDSRLRLSDHLNSGTRNASQKINIIRKVKGNLNKDTTVLIFKTMVLPL